MITVEEKIKFIKNFDGKLTQLDKFIEYSNDVCNEVDRLKSVIRNTPLGKKKRQSDVRPLDELRTGDTIVLNDTDEYTSRNVISDDRYATKYQFTMNISEAERKIKEGTALRVPSPMFMGKDCKYQKININEKEALIGTGIYKETYPDDIPFVNHVLIWIPQKNNYIKIVLGMYGNSNKAKDKMTINLNYYRTEERNSVYQSKSVEESRVYAPFIEKALELYREASGHTEFLKENK